MSRYTARGFRERASRAALNLGNMIRRVVVATTEGSQWGLEGYAIPDLRGGDAVMIEGEGEDPLEVFGGMHFAARPAAGDNAEGLVLAVGGEAGHRVFGALRNEAARARYVAEFGELAEGEVAVFNSGGTARVLIRFDGSIEVTPAAGQEVLISTSGGSPVALATKADLDKLLGVLEGWTPAPTDGGLVLKNALISAYGPTYSCTGTITVKGE